MSSEVFIPDAPIDPELSGFHDNDKQDSYVEEDEVPILKMESPKMDITRIAIPKEEPAAPSMGLFGRMAATFGITSNNSDEQSKVEKSDMFDVPSFMRRKNKEE